MKSSKRRGQPCHDCGRTMRVKGELVSEYPDTVIHQARGYCYPCMKIRARNNKLPTKPAPPPPPVEPWPNTLQGHDSDDERDRTNARTAQAWLDARRARGVPAEGLNYWERAA